MFEVNNDLSIHITRGDIALLTVTADSGNAAYVFEKGDIVRLKVYEKKGCDCVVLMKDITVEETTEKVDILLTGDDTRIGEVIHKPKDYWYEVELNPATNPQTIIGYDENGAKVFRLYPEGKEIEYEPGDDINILEQLVEKEVAEEVAEVKESAEQALELSQQNAEDIEELKQTGGGVPQMFEKIGVWHWENIDMRLDPSYSPAVGNSGSIGKYLEADIGGNWTIINPYRSTDSAPSITRIARYSFPDGKAYKKVIAMMSFDPNFIPEGYITDLEKSRGFKEGEAYGQKATGDPVYSTVRFIGDMGGTGTLLRIDSHNKDSQGFVKVLLTKEEGLWTLTRTERTDNPGNRSDLRHYQSGFYGSYDVAQPVYHEAPHDADNLGSYERITGFEFETILPWYDTDNSGSGDKLNNLRGMLCLYGVPEDSPEDVYGLKIHNIALDNRTKYNVSCRTKQYAGGIVCLTVYDVNFYGVNAIGTTASGEYVEVKWKRHTDASHHGEIRDYFTFKMPDDDVEIQIVNGK